jgi:nitrogen fixation protein FixH
MTNNVSARVKGWHVLAAMLAFFGVVIAINVGFTVAAIRSFPGEDERLSYMQGLHFNDALAERRAQRMLGWRASAELERAENGASLIVVMRTRDGEPIEHLGIAATLGRRASAAYDQTLVFNPQGGGVYVAALPALAAGKWRLRARATNSRAQALDFESDLRWPSP